MSSGKLASQATVTKNGTMLRMLGDVEFDKGGEKRTPQMGPDGVLGYTVEMSAPELSGKALLATGEKLSDCEFEDATVVVTMNTGQKWILRNAYTMEPAKWSGGKGEVALKVSCVGKPEEL